MNHCGVEPLIEPRPTLSRYVCPICGAWQYVATDRPEIWVAATVKDSLTVRTEAWIEGKA